MYKKYIVRLSEEERRVCLEVVKKLKGSSQKARRAQILLKADADGPGWPDAKIAEAYGAQCGRWRIFVSDWSLLALRLPWSARNVRRRRPRASWMAWAKRS